MSNYDPYSVHAYRGLGAWQRKQGNNVQYFIWNGSTWTISPNTIQTNQRLTTGGIQLSFDLRFSALTSQFLIPPVVNADQVRAEMLQNGGTPMSYLGGLFNGEADNYKIEAVDISPNGLILTIGANSISEDA